MKKNKTSKKVSELEKTGNNYLKKTIDRPWFENQMKKLGIRQKDIAAKLGLKTVSIVAHIFAGRRHVQANEIAPLARLFQVSNDEMMARCYFISEDMTLSHDTESICKVVGYIDSNLNVVYGPVKGIDAIENPFKYPHDEKFVALLFRTVGGPFDYFDGQTAYFQKPNIDFLDPDLIGRPCLVKTKKGTFYRILRNGKKGRYNLYLLDNKTLDVESAAVLSTVYIRVV